MEHAHETLSPHEQSNLPAASLDIPDHITYPNRDDVETWQRILQTHGRPEHAESYQFTLEDDAMDQSTLDWFKQSAHDAGLLPFQAQQLLDAWQGLAKNNVGAMERKSQEDLAMLKQNWGGQFDSHIEQARRGMRHLALNEADVSAIEQALGTKTMLTIFDKIGQSIKEPDFIDEDHLGQRDDATDHRDDARSKLQTLMADSSFMEKYLSGSQSHIQQMRELLEHVHG